MISLLIMTDRIKVLHSALQRVSLKISAAAVRVLMSTTFSAARRVLLS
jgi:hypothetical protein